MNKYIARIHNAGILFQPVHEFSRIDGNLIEAYRENNVDVSGYREFNESRDIVKVDFNSEVSKIEYSFKQFDEFSIPVTGRKLNETEFERTKKAIIKIAQLKDKLEKRAKLQLGKSFSALTQEEKTELMFIEMNVVGGTIGDDIIFTYKPKLLSVKAKEANALVISQVKTFNFDTN